MDSSRSIFWYSDWASHKNEEDLSDGDLSRWGVRGWGHPRGDHPFVVILKLLSLRDWRLNSYTFARTPQIIILTWACHYYTVQILWTYLRSSSVTDLVQGFHHDDGGILSTAASGVEQSKQDEQSHLWPYLLLAVKTEDEYLKGHIKTARNYSKVIIPII